MNTNLIAIAVANLVAGSNVELTPKVKSLLDMLGGALQLHHREILEVKRLAAKVASPELHKAISLVADRTELEDEMNAPRIVDGPTKTVH